MATEALRITCHLDEQNKEAKHWLQIMNELRNRRVEDILLAVVDGLKGFPENIRRIFPQREVQTCIVHLIHYIWPCAISKKHGKIHH